MSNNRTENKQHARSLNLATSIRNWNMLLIQKHHARKPPITMAASVTIKAADPGRKERAELSSSSSSPRPGEDPLSLVEA
jgi:hypothetical protein